MPELSRRLIQEQPETWHIFYDRVNVGAISQRIGNPSGTPAWHWYCGFYPGGALKAHRSGTADSFDEARERFEQAWATYLPLHTADNFREWRHHTAWTAEKYARWERGERSAPPSPLPGWTDE